MKSSRLLGLRGTLRSAPGEDICTKSMYACTEGMQKAQITQKENNCIRQRLDGFRSGILFTAVMSVGVSRPDFGPPLEI